MLLLDISLPDGSGIDLLRQIRPHKPDLPILILSMHPEEQFAVNLLRAGASGYITKDAVPQDVVSAIRTLLNGRKYISPAVAQILADDVGGDNRPAARAAERKGVPGLLQAGRGPGGRRYRRGAFSQQQDGQHVSRADPGEDEREVERRSHLLRDQEWSHTVAAARRLRSPRGRPPAVHRKLPRARKPTGACLRVFLVEDSASIRDRLGDFLSEPGKIEMIGFAVDRGRCRAPVATQPVDVAIVDLNLKEGTGIGVIESVRALHAKAPPTIVVLTNYAFPEFEAACRERGADYFFDKSTQFGAVKMLLQSIRRSRH